jgi:hypothetical protein
VRSATRKRGKKRRIRSTLRYAAGGHAACAGVYRREAGRRVRAERLVRVGLSAGDNERSASFTAVEFLNRLATSGARTTTLVLSKYL